MPAVQKIVEWAKSVNVIEKIEVLTFLDKGESINWLSRSGVKVQNLLTKGSLNHLTNQLKKKPGEHFKEIDEIINLAKNEGIETNVYLEDWSNGMRNSKKYVMDLIDILSNKGINRILLPDTLGVLTTNDTYCFINEKISKYTDLHFDINSNNDNDLRVANV